MSNTFRPAYRTVEDLMPYSAGKPVEELAREKGLTRIVKLASNENPLGMSPMVSEAVRRAAVEVHRYPDGATWELKEKLAHRLGVRKEMIVLGNGSNEILELMAQLFLTDSCVIIQNRGHWHRGLNLLKIDDGQGLVDVQRTVRIVATPVINAVSNIGVLLNLR